MNHVGQALCIAATIPALFLIAYANEKDRDVVRVDQRTVVLASFVGRCFDNGMNAVGKVFHMEDEHWGMLAFPSGATGAYRITDLMEKTCPFTPEGGITARREPPRHGN